MYWQMQRRQQEIAQEKRFAKGQERQVISETNYIHYLAKHKFSRWKLINTLLPSNQNCYFGVFSSIFSLYFVNLILIVQDLCKLKKYQFDKFNRK